MPAEAGIQAFLRFSGFPLAREALPEEKFVRRVDFARPRSSYR